MIFLLKKAKLGNYRQFNFFYKSKHLFNLVTMNYANLLSSSYIKVYRIKFFYVSAQKASNESKLLICSVVCTLRKDLPKEKHNIKLSKSFYISAY